MWLKDPLSQYRTFTEHKSWETMSEETLRALVALSLASRLARQERKLRHKRCLL